MTWRAVPVRMVEQSSSKITSCTQCMAFSMLQWSRSQAAHQLWSYVRSPKRGLAARTAAAEPASAVSKTLAGAVKWVRFQS
jgi:hypothetical protein